MHLTCIPLQFSDSSIKVVKVIAPKILSDNKGAFFETYKKNELSAHGIPVSFVQENVSVTKKLVLRGLHCISRHSFSELLSDVFSLDGILIEPVKT